MTASHSWLLLTIPAAVAAIALLSWTILSLVRTVRSSVIASVPIRAEQIIEIDRSGELALNLESPLLSRRPAALRFMMMRADDAMQIPLRPIVFRTEATSLSRSRIELYSLTIPSPGRYSLRIDGVDPSMDYGGDAIVFARRYGATLVLHILALILLGAILIGSMVLSGLILTNRLLPSRPSSPAAATP